MKKEKEIQVVKEGLVLPTHLCFKQIQRQSLETSVANHLGRELEELPLRTTYNLLE